MKNFGKQFIVSLILEAAAVGLLLAHYPLYAAFALIPAFFLNAGEIEPYSTPYQFINFRSITLLLGLSIDLTIGENTWYYTAMMFMTPFLALLRLELFNYMVFDRHVWTEVLGFISVYGIYLFAGLQHPARWEGWVLPVPPMILLSYIGSSMIVRAAVTKKVKVEYKAVIGSKAPLFELPDTLGNQVKLSDLIGNNHVLLVFVRGDWCPSCHIMVRTYEKQRELFLKKEIITVTICPDSAEINKEMTRRLGLKNMVLSDHKQNTAMSYGIQMLDNTPQTNYEEGLPLPASFLLDKAGTVRYIYRPDQGEFMNPALIFPVLEQLN